jgi:hypothetical protein
MSAVGRAQTLIGQRGRVDAAAGVKGDALVGLRSATGAALIAATVLASAVGTLDANVITVAAPAIGRGLHASVSTQAMEPHRLSADGPRADVAALAVYIMSNTALTGATYNIDGGRQLVG